MNFTTFTFGEKNSGKTFCLQNNEKEKGAYEIVYSKIISSLEQKKEILLNNQSSNISDLEEKKLTKYSYNLKLKFIELKDEKSYDLLQKYNYFKQPAEILFTETEGYSSIGSAYVNIANLDNFNALLKDAFELKNQDKNSLNKSTTIFTLEISQLFEYQVTSKINSNETIENNLITSKVNILEMPSADILIENKNAYNNDSYKSIFAFQNLISELVKSNLTFNIDPDVYEFSYLTKLLKVYLGMNSICLGIFNLKRSNFQINELSFKLMKLCQKILCYPLINDKITNVISRKFRNEILNLKNKLNRAKIDVKFNNNNQNQNSIKNKTDKFKNNLDNNDLFANDNLNSMNADSNSALVDQLRNKINILQKEISRLEHELKLSEEEKIKFLNNFNSNQGRLQSNATPYGNNKPNKLDVIDQDIKEQLEIMNTLNQLQEKLRLFAEEKRDLEEENLNLKSAYIRLNNDIELIKSKNSNLVNNLNNEILQLKNLMNSNKAEVEFLRNSRDNTVKLKDSFVEDLGNKQNLYDEKANDIRREFEDKLFEANSNNLKNIEKIKRYLTLRNDNLLDEVSELKKTNQDLTDENKRLLLQNDEIRSSFRDLLSKYDKETQKFNLLDNRAPEPANAQTNQNLNNSQINNRLNNSNLTANKNAANNNNAINKNLINNNINNNVNKTDNSNIGQNNQSLDQIKNKVIEQKEKYLEVLSQKEKELDMNLLLEKTKNNNLSDKNKNLKLMLRKLKNIALDYYPNSEGLRENDGNNRDNEKSKEEENEILKLLNGDFDQIIDNQENDGLVKFYEFEVKQLRDRIVSLENENIRYKSNNKNTNTNPYIRENSNINNEANESFNNFDNKVQMKILEEIEKLKRDNNNRSQSSWHARELDKIKFENSNLREEIVKLKRQLIQSSKIIENGSFNNKNGFDFDPQQNEKLLKKLQIKNDFFEKALHKSEKENVELKIRANSAEEQLSSLQQYITNMNKMRNNLI